MAESMSIQAILSATDSGFSSVMKNAQQAVSGLGGASDQVTKQNGSFMSSVKSIASGIGVYKLASAGLGAISSGFGNVVGEMTESNIAWQTFDGNMQMLGNSPQQIGKVQKSLQDFATASIYSASDMATTYAQMAALGVDNTEQLVKGMGGLASSAENPQQAMKTLSQQMVQALAKPEMQWADFKLMMEQAPSAMAQVAKHMGMSLDELILGIQDGEIASKDFAQAVAEVGTNEQFSKLATTYKSTGQALDGLSETLSNKLMPAFKALDKIGIKAVEGLSDMIDKVDIEGLVEGFSRVAKVVAPAFREIGKHISKVSGQVKQFFEPMTKGFGEIGKAVRTFGSDMLLAMSYIGLGEWDKAWDTIKSSALRTFDTITSAMGKMVSGMWDNFKVLLDNFNNFDWSTVWNALDAILSPVQDAILSINWKVVGEEVGSVVREFVEANLPKLLTFTQEVLLNPDSELNMEAGEFHDQVMALFDGFFEEALNIDIPAPILSWDSWDKAIEEASQRMNKSIMDLISRSRMLLQAWENPNIDVEVMLDILTLRGQGWSEEEIKDYIDDNYEPGTYDAQIEVLPSLNVGEIDPTMMSSQIQTWFGDKSIEVTQKVIADIEVFEGQGFSDDRIKQMIDDKYGQGFYEFATSVTADIEELELSGISEIEIAQAIDDKYGAGTYELITGINVETQLENIEGVSADDIQAEIEAVLGNQEMSVDAKVAMIIDIMEGAGVEASEIEAYIDSQFPPGAYEKVMQVIAQIETALQMGMSEAEIKQRIDDFYGEGTYESVVNVNVTPKHKIVQGPMDARDGLSSMIRTDIEGKFAQKPLTPEIKVAPKVTMSGGVGGVEGESGIDLSGITAQIESQLSSLEATVSSALEGIQSTITSQASTWGTSIATAMTTMVTSVTATMTAMTLAVTLGMTAMTLAVTMAMTSLAETVTTTMTSMAETVTTTMTSMVETVTQAMTSMAEAITQAMTAMVEAVTAGMEEAVAVAQSGAEGIVSAVSGLYDSMYDAGRSAGEGLADGLSSMEGAVRSAASALASAANIAAQATFLINSPSKVWRGFGYSAGEGLVDGFDGSQRSVKKSATRLAVAGLPSIAPFSGRSSHVSVSGNVSTTQQNAELKSELSQIKKAIKEGQVIMLDGNTWVGATVDRIDTALGNNQSLGGRHQLS